MSHQIRLLMDAIWRNQGVLEFVLGYYFRYCIRRQSRLETQSRDTRPVKLLHIVEHEPPGECREYRMYFVCLLWPPLPGHAAIFPFVLRARPKFFRAELRSGKWYEKVACWYQVTYHFIHQPDRVCRTSSQQCLIWHC
jgi:hypothetical protein